MPVKNVSFDRPVTKQEVQRLQAMAEAMRERPRQQVNHPLQAAANFANDAAGSITEFVANRREQKRREALIGALQGKTLPGLDPEMFASMMNNDPDQAQQMYINAQIAAEQARRQQAAQAAQWQRQQDAQRQADDRRALQEDVKAQRERDWGREDYLWQREQSMPKPMTPEQRAEWGIPENVGPVMLTEKGPQPIVGGASNMFEGNSLPAQGLNYLVQTGELTRQQAAEVASGKSITLSDGSEIFMAPQGLARRPAQPNIQQSQPPVQPQQGQDNPYATVIGKPGSSSGQKAVDAAFAKEYAEWVGQGGASDTFKQIAQLEDVANALESGNDNISGWFVGNMPDAINTIANPDAVKYRERVEEVVQRNLRLILGAQFTKEEGERLIKRSFNPRLDEKENATRIRALLQQMNLAAQQKADASRYFEENGTLQGWRGKLPSLSDFESIFSTDDRQGDGQTVQPGVDGGQPQQEQKKRLRYNPETGEFE